MPSQKQINYCLLLLGKAGFSTSYMNSQFKELGASMRERSGKVEDWISAMDFGTCSRLIDRLKLIVASKEAIRAAIAQDAADRERAHRVANTYKTPAKKKAAKRALRRLATPRRRSAP